VSIGFPSFEHVSLALITGLLVVTLGAIVLGRSRGA
jgi:hypothetical protein